MPPTRKRQPRKSGGLGRVAQAASRQKGKRKWLKLDDGDVVTLRVVDTGEDFKDAYVHRVQMEREDGSTYYADVPCLDQDEKGKPCPGCKDDIDRRYKFWTNVIVRDWEDEETGKVGDVLMVWGSGITIAKRLDKLDARHGLINRDIEVERQGSTMKNTKYEIEWATDENVPLSDADRELIKDKADLTRYVKPPEFDDFYKPPGERNKDDDENVGEQALKRNTFKRRTEKSGEKQTSVRRRTSSSSKPKPTGLAGFGPNKSESTPAKKTTVRRRSR